MRFFSTNNLSERVDFETALLNGIASYQGLYMVDKSELPVFNSSELQEMRSMTYAQIAFKVLHPFTDIPNDTMESMLKGAYPDHFDPVLQRVTGNTHLLWLTKGPTYSFKDYAARFFGRTLDYFTKKRGKRKIVLTATSGDTGGAVADALHGLLSIDTVVFYPKDSISQLQREHMTTIGDNVYAFEVNGDFDVCQALAKHLLSDKAFAEYAFNDDDILTSANSISIGRLLPQIVFPFYAYSRLESKKPMTISIPSGNFGDLMGTIIAKYMGLPIEKCIAAVNDNDVFPRFMRTRKYEVRSTIPSPSSAMNVSHPSNLARLVQFYGGHFYDLRDPKTGEFVKPWVMDLPVDFTAMQKDIASLSVNTAQHYRTIGDVFVEHGIILDPHGAVGWRALETYLLGLHQRQSIVYETAEPFKFPDVIQEAIGITPLPPKDETRTERIYKIMTDPECTDAGLRLSEGQIEEAQSKLCMVLA